MARINWGRLMLGTLIAAIIMFAFTAMMFYVLMRAFFGAALYKDAPKPAVA